MTWATERTIPNSERTSSRRSRRATESAPAETATARRSPARMEPCLRIVFRRRWARWCTGEWYRRERLADNCGMTRREATGECVRGYADVDGRTTASSSQLLCFGEMRGVRGIAISLLLVLLAPVFGPLAMAGVLGGASHCVRQRVLSPASDSTADPNAGAMPCHSARPEATRTDDASRALRSETSFRAQDGCCANHGCCSVGASGGTQAASALPLLSFLIEAAHLICVVELPSIDIAGRNPARAPPLR